MQYITNDREQESLPANQKSFAIIHVFTGQMATTMLDLYKKKAILKLRVPANMTQLLDWEFMGMQSDSRVENSKIGILYRFLNNWMKANRYTTLMIHYNFHY